MNEVNINKFKQFLREKSLSDDFMNEYNVFFETKNLYGSDNGWITIKNIMTKEEKAEFIKSFIAKHNATESELESVFETE